MWQKTWIPAQSHNIQIIPRRCLFPIRLKNSASPADCKPFNNSFCSCWSISLSDLYVLVILHAWTTRSAVSVSPHASHEKKRFQNVAFGNFFFSSAHETRQEEMSTKVGRIMKVDRVELAMMESWFEELCFSGRRLTCGELQYIRKLFSFESAPSWCSYFMEVSFVDCSSFRSVCKIWQKVSLKRGKFIKKSLEWV